MTQAPEVTLAAWLRRARAAVVAAEVLAASGRAAIAFLTLLCLSLLAERIFDLSFTATLAAAAIPGFAVWLAAALLPGSFSLSACALRVDRAFKLDERLSTASEILASGGRDPLSIAQIDDAAARRVAIADVFASAARGLSAKAAVAAVLALIAAVIILLPRETVALRSDGETVIVRAAAVKIDDAVRSLPAPADARPEIKAVAAALAQLTTRAANQNVSPREFHERLQQIARDVAALRSNPALTPGEAAMLKDLADRLDAAGTSLAAELRRHGLLSDRTGIPPEVLTTLIRLREDAGGNNNNGGGHASARPPVSDLFTRPANGAIAPGATLPAADAILRSFEAPSWLPMYNEPIRRYYAAEDSDWRKR